ncbi:MAG: D-2-hydroxyacid dehydrogenase [Pseudomonadota bacterium]
MTSARHPSPQSGTHPARRPALKIAVMMYRGHDAIARLADRFADVSFVAIEGTDAFRREIVDADALIIFGQYYDAEIAEAIGLTARSLRWIQFATAGIDAVLRHGAPPGIAVTNAGAAWAPTVAEHAFALLIGLARRLHELERDRGRAAWRRGPLADCLATLEGARLLVVGFGAVGREVGRRARAFDMTVTGVARQARREPLAERVVGVADLEAVLPAADAVVLALPLSRDTERMFDARRLALMKSSAFLVNVSRGGVIDEAALVAALMAGRLAGAGLDVFMREPLPADHPLWRLPNVILSPHVAGYGGSQAFARLAALFAANIERFRSGAPLLNRVEIPA